jgi:hypothetical protein
MSHSIQSISVRPQMFKNALVYYYMPGCPYCKEFEPVFLELLHLTRKAKSLLLLAVDITEHERLNIPVKTVPTIYYFDGLGAPHKLEASSREQRSLYSVASFLIKEHMHDYYRKKGIQSWDEGEQ